MVYKQSSWQFRGLGERTMHLNGLVRFVVCAALLGSSPLLAGDSRSDRLEPGKQGETMPGEATVLAVPYSKGVRRVGHNTIEGRSGNLIMAWSGNCAYVANGIGLSADGNIGKQPHGPKSGVAVIDVRNPDVPRLTGYLQDKGAIDASETMHAVTVRGRAVLAASTYGGVPGMNGPPEGWLNLYDVSDCARPRLMAEVKWPEPAHTITVSPDGRRVYGTIISPFTGGGGIQVMDISDLTSPRFVGRFAATRPDGSSFEFAPHELSVSPDERRLYVGTIASKGGDLNPGVAIMPPNAEGLGPQAGGIYIFDNSDLVAGRPDPKLRLIGTSLHGGWHSAVQARIGGVPHLVAAGELGACPGAWPKITNVADERNPRIVGEFRLDMNRPENCPERNAIEKASGGVVGRAGTASTHFNDVDSATDTRLGLFPMGWAGLRIADLRNPVNPLEVAYFKPGDFCGSHVRYVPRTGHIWFACGDSGFHVIALTQQLRRSLRLPRAGR
jgi:LVIVD repeat